MELFKKNIALLVLVIVIFISFFLPWINVESVAVGGISKVLTGKKQALIDSVSGFDVPVLANSEESRFMITIIKIFQPKITDADKKSFLIWIIPLLSIGMFVISSYCNKNKWVHAIIAVLSISIFAVATFKILSTDLDKLVLKVNISYGLWLILCGYLGIGIVEAINFVKLTKKGSAVSLDIKESV